LEFSSDQEAETLRVQLVAMAKEQESMLYLASTRERPNKQWSSVDFRGYERSVTDEHPAQDELEEFENAA
jgi:hypothetical protein